MNMGEHGRIAPHRVRPVSELFLTPSSSNALEIVADQQWTAAFAKVVGLTSLESFLAQAAFQVRHSG